MKTASKTPPLFWLRRIRPGRWGFLTPQKMRGNLKPLQIYPDRQIISLVIFQVVWLTTVLGVANDRIWPGVAALCFALVIHASISATAKIDLVLVSIAVTLGLLIDTVLIRAGLLSFEMNLPWPGIAPVWVLILWANFALILNNGLQWLQGRFAIAAILGLIGGPLSYLGGIRLGAGELHVALPTAFLIIGSCWAIVTPLLLIAARQLTQGTFRT